MATRRTPAPPPPPVQLTVDQMTKGITRLERVIAEVEAFDVSQLQKRGSHDVEALEQRIVDAVDSVFGEGSAKARHYYAAARLDNGPWRVITEWDQRHYDEGAEARQYVAEGKERAATLLRQAVKWLHEEIADAVPATAVSAVPAQPKELSRKVFIVHGHDGAAKHAVARFVATLGFEAVILHEQANEGRTIIEKVDALGGEAGFAIVLLTPDDEGAKKGEIARPRPRQNVVMELGYFIGKLGRKHVCALKTPGDMDLPSDILGVVWEELDPDSHAWKMSLARELKAAGYDIDWNVVMQ